MINAYGYHASPSNTYVLLRDGEVILRGTEGDVWEHIHAHHSYSVSWAIAHEGFQVRTAEECFASAVSGKDDPRCAR